MSVDIDWADDPKKREMEREMWEELQNESDV